MIGSRDRGDGGIVEIDIAGQNYVMKSDESPEHMEEVANLVKKRVESLMKKHPKLGIARATMLTAFDFASQMVKSSKKGSELKGGVLTKAKLLLNKVEKEIAQRAQ